MATPLIDLLRTHAKEKGTDGGASEARVLALLAAKPEAAWKEKDYGGRLPLHYALEKGASEAVVLAVLAANPDAAKAKDNVRARRACARGRAGVGARGGGGGGVWAREGRWPSALTPRVASALRTVCPEARPLARMHPLRRVGSTSHHQGGRWAGGWGGWSAGGWQVACPRCGRGRSRRTGMR